MQMVSEFEKLVQSTKADASIEQNAREVRARFGPMFTPSGIASLDPDLFKAFLRPGENRHWSGINRQSGKLTADLPLLKKALLALVDETKPVSNRIDEARDIIDGLGRAVISAILQVSFPSKYGVYNRISAAGLEALGMHPRGSVPRFDSLSWGDRYSYFNRVLVELSTRYDISLWSLDTIWWPLTAKRESDISESTNNQPASTLDSLVDNAGEGAFALEKHLEEFLVENWGQVPELATSLDILTDEDGEMTGEQYQTRVGRIDLLCKNRDGSGYTVIELKLGQTNDQTVGQVIRYMGAVKKELPLKGSQSVRGVIICRDADESLMTALTVVPDISVFTYNVSFALTKKG